MVNRKLTLTEYCAKHPSSRLLSMYSKKNINTPDEVMAYSEDDYLWVCESGHEFKLSPKKMINRTRHCPICEPIKKPLSLSEYCKIKNNDILIKMYGKSNLISPDKVSILSTNDVLWECPKGHQIIRSPKNMIHSLHPCPQCAKNTSFESYCITHNKQEVLLMYSSDNKKGPDEIPVAYTKAVLWECKNGHRFELSPYNMNRRVKHYCHLCLEESSLAKDFPSLLKYWDYDKNTEDPNTVSSSSIQSKKYYWKCNKGHSFSQRIQSPDPEKFTCPICKKNANLLINARPDLIDEWDAEKNTIDIHDITIGNSSARIWWKCKVCGGSYIRSVQKKALKNTCPYCSGHSLLKGFNDYATIYPMAALDWDYSKNGELKPSDIPKRYKETINWKCHICGYEWEESPVKRKGKECPICKKKKKTL